MKNKLPAVALMILDLGSALAVDICKLIDISKYDIAPKNNKNLLKDCRHLHRHRPRTELSAPPWTTRRQLRLH